MSLYTVIDSYCKRFYHEGHLNIQDATEWSRLMMRSWFDDVEAQVYWVLDEIPEINPQMAVDILYACEHDTTAIPLMIDELLESANQSVLPYLDQFLLDTKKLGYGVELQTTSLNGYGGIEIKFSLLDINTIHLWQAQGYMYRGDRYALL